MQKVKVGIIIAGLGLAAVIFVCNMKSEEPIEVAKDEIKTLWLCGSCNHQFEMTSKEEFEASQNVPNSTPPLNCPQCKTRECYRANLCGECGTAFFGPEVPNSTGVCPKCHPDAKPKPPEDIEEEDQGSEEGISDEVRKKSTIKAI